MRQRETVSYLTRIRLTSLTARQMSALSNKRRRQITVTHVLVRNPSIILMSRPVTDLSPGTKQRIVSLLRAVIQRQKLAVVYGLRRLSVTVACTSQVVNLLTNRIILSRPIAGIGTGTLS